MSKNEAVVEGLWFGEDVIAGMDISMLEAMEISGKRIADRAQSLIPIGPGDPMHLRDTVRVKKGRKDKKAVFVIAGNRLKGVYWHFMQEYGTYFKSAKPFMRPAVDQNFNATKAEAARAGKREVNKARRASTKTRKFLSKFTLG